MPVSHIPNGFTSLTPYFIVDDGDKFLTFLDAAFECEVVDDHREEGKMRHAAIRIYGSMIEASEATGEYAPRHYCLHLYVPDCDAVFKKALAAGAKSIRDVADMPYGERSGGVKDPFGNEWWISTQQADMYPTV